MQPIKGRGYLELGIPNFFSNPSCPYAEEMANISCTLHVFQAGRAELSSTILCDSPIGGEIASQPAIKITHRLIQRRRWLEVTRQIAHLSPGNAGFQRASAGRTQRKP